MLMIIKMRSYSDDADNAYIIMRVSQIDSESPDLKCFPNPWRLYLEGVLQFASAGGYHVCESRPSRPTPDRGIIIVD